MDGRILAIGGFGPDTMTGVPFDSVEARPVGGRGTWRDVASMRFPRANPAAAELAGKVYIAGGFGVNDSVLDSVERFDPRTGSWSTSPKMPFARGSAGAAALDGLLYVAGGSLKDETITDSVIVFDPRKRTWKSVAPMPTARWRVRLVATGHHLYAIGGVSARANSLNTVERYDPRSDSWTTVASMKQDRGVPGAVVVNRGSQHLIVVVGGAQVTNNVLKGFLRSTEVYHPDTGEWQVLEAQLPRAKASLVAAVESDGTVLAIGGAVRLDEVPTVTADVLALKIGR